MKIKNRIDLLGYVLTLTVLPIADALARFAPTVPEPSVMSLGAAAAVAGIIVHRLRKKK